jgi:hypothetical protein
MEYFETKRFPNEKDIFHRFSLYPSQLVRIITCIELLKSKTKNGVPKDSDTDSIEKQIIQGNANKK